MMKHYLDVFLLIFQLAIFAGAIKGWGLIFARCAFGDAYLKVHLLHYWLGLVIAVIYVEGLNLITPIDNKVILLFYGFGVLFTLLGMGRRRRAVRNSIGRYKTISVGAIPVGAFAVFVGFVCLSKIMIPSLHFDVDLYYLQTVKWMNESQTPFGLGNLHTRLGYNQSFFALVALLNLFPYWTHGLAAINLLLMMLVLVTVILTLDPKTRTGRNIAILFFVVFLDWFYSPDSPSPDRAVGLLQVAIFVISFQLLLMDESGQSDAAVKKRLLLLLGLVCALTLTVKLSALAYVGLTLLVMLSRAKPFDSLDRRALLFLCAVCGSLLFVHCMRGYVLTGYPFYPSGILGAQTAVWAVSNDTRFSDLNWIFSAARAPGINPKDIVGYSWLYNWLASVPISSWLMFGLSLACVCICLSAKGLDNKRALKHLLFLYIPTVGGLLFWFLTAPDWRFVGALPELLLLLSVCIGYLKFFEFHDAVKSFRIMRVVVLGVTAVCLVLLFRPIWLENAIRHVGLEQFYSFMPTAEADYVIGRTGWKIVNFCLIVCFLLWLIVEQRLFRGVGRLRPLILLTISICVINQTALVMGFFLGDLQGWRPVTLRSYSKFDTEVGASINVANEQGVCGEAPLPCAMVGMPKLVIEKSSGNYRMFYLK